MKIARSVQNLFSAAICLVAIAAMIPATGALAAGSSEKLQALVNDTSAQIDLAYRQRPAERDARQKQLAEAVKSWRAAERNETNNERLASWLRATILSSMPGSQEPIPAAPSFAAPARIASPQSIVAPTKQVEQKTETAADPFRDDPVD